MAFPPKRYGWPSAVALAANGFQIGNARQPLALRLPSEIKWGIRHVPLAARALAYVRSLTRKRGQCRLLAHRDLASRIHVRNAPKATNPNRRECPEAEVSRLTNKRRKKY